MTNTSTLQNNSDNSVMKNVIQNAGSILGTFLKELYLLY